MFKNSSFPSSNYCIILDIDSTLIYSFDQEETDLLFNQGITLNPEYFDIYRRMYKLKLEDVFGKRGKGDKLEMWGILRPYVKEFLTFCSHYFKIVAIWSAGREKYVDALVDILFLNLPRPHIIYSYHHCQYHNKILTKPLLSMISQNSGLEHYMSPSNTFVLDDTLPTFSLNPDNGIHIPPFRPKPHPSDLRFNDTFLSQLVQWFTSLDNDLDVRSIPKSIFTIPPKN